MDRLTSFERMKALVQKGDLDRIPVFSLAIAYSAVVSGLTLEDFYLNPEKALDAQLWASDLHQYDGNPTYNIPEWGGWDFGGELSFPKSPNYALPNLSKRPVISEKDVQHLKVPVFISAPAGKRMIRFARLAREKGYPAIIPGGSPMGLAGSVVEPALLLRWICTRPELVHEILRLCTDYLLQIADIFIEEFGPEACSVFSTFPWECHAVVSPKVFEHFTLPYVKQIHERLIDKGLRRWVIHLCGDHTRNLHLWLKEIPLVSRTIFTVGHEMDIFKTAKVLGEDYIIGGNVSTILMQSGIPKQVFEESRHIIQKMKNHPGGFIIMPSCALPPTTPSANLHAMVKAAREFGSYE
ncbi:uroporphyrinogen decarboxylase family protein [Candidatus Contubernalis alkaliaceticus]|uniref:uroporphyrinogen decarboxylase family protein n=1 Tax=Candidatus Contubernalis alkaliaceticus TaxID=338645 RepID=UPI001F4C42B0|nr:uroporphyrinogen decarboxylase family protein [Candidatus Contubernalis alkalaceticus]UNC90848.1 hypothetical protein HUE98_01355 [Candidatus Contubernalis alkalaceticus]